ncbi:MAG: S49 family peptidase [Candidatus Bathyarchaeota archaeon]|nr:S49 family peptidase [Candidatus Bathyarchaeota archaeon]
MKRSNKRLASLKKSIFKKENKSLFLIVILILAAYSSLFFITKPYRPNNIGIIEICGQINSSEKYEFIMDMIEFAKKNETIKAVVLSIDSPGGFADIVQDIYMNLLDLRESKPIVAHVVGFGVSGAYYIAVSADYIYAVPAAMVGNVGVIVTLPGKPEPLESVMETGPYKQRGISGKDFPFSIQSVLDDFLDAVESQRGEVLKLERVELSKGLMYIGREASDNGMIDEVGSSHDAISKAAELANLGTYSVIEIDDYVEKPFIVSIGLSRDQSGLTLDTLMKIRDPPAFYYIYANPDIDSDEQAINTSWPSEDMNLGFGDSDFILVDISHENGFMHWETNILFYELASRSHSIRYVNSSEKLGEMLIGAKAFIIINPKTFFSDEEITSIKDYVGSGGKLLLISDPTRNSTSYMNSLTTDFGMLFGNGYLYNLDEKHGNYRNIIIEEYHDNNITQGLQKTVFFTATHILSESGKIGFTSEMTYNSESESTGEYSPIVLLPDKEILAIGDQTFFMEPYCYTFDNYYLIENIADFLTN